MTNPYEDALFDTAAQLITDHMTRHHATADLELVDEEPEGATLTYTFTNTDDEDRFDPNLPHGHYTVARDFDDSYLETFDTPDRLMAALDEALETDTDMVSVSASIAFLEALITHLTEQEAAA